jgi:WD40 repeat protein
VVHGHAGPIVSVTVMAGGRTAVTAAEGDSALRLWDLTPGCYACTGTLDGHQRQVLSVVELEANGGTLVASAAADGTVKARAPHGCVSSRLSVGSLLFGQAACMCTYRTVFDVLAIRTGSRRPPRPVSYFNFLSSFCESADLFAHDSNGPAV